MVQRYASLAPDYLANEVARLDDAKKGKKRETSEKRRRRGSEGANLLRNNGGSSGRTRNLQPPVNSHLLPLSYWEYVHSRARRADRLILAGSREAVNAPEPSVLRQAGPPA